MLTSKLASKQELKNGLMGYFEVNEDITNVYMIETSLDIEDIETMDLEMVDENIIDKMIDYIFRFYVK